MVSAKTFREDLYYRLNVVRIQAPPLRRRKEDIPLLVSHFIKTLSDKEKKDVKGITDGALKKLLKYDFPGNVRELENIIKRAIVFSRGDYLTDEDISVPVDKKLKLAGRLNDEVENLERGMITEALKKHDWNQSKAADELGISERTIRYKMEKYNIEKN